MFLSGEAAVVSGKDAPIIVEVTIGGAQLQ